MSLISSAPVNVFYTWMKIGWALEEKLRTPICVLFEKFVNNCIITCSFTIPNKLIYYFKSIFNVHFYAQETSAYSNSYTSILYYR